MTKQLCKNCKHLETDGMFGIFCGVGGNNRNHDCSKYEEKTQKRFTMTERYSLLYGVDENPYEWDIIDNELNAIIEQGNGVAIINAMNELHEEKQLQDERISLLSSLIDLADAIIDTSDNEKAKSVWENKNEDFERKWEELND